tara:strand:+ start:523 stop:1371 length:849 start_codon:yes stop_codon:yes gene_type:complete
MLFFKLNEELGQFFLYRSLRFVFRKGKEIIRDFFWQKKLYRKRNYFGIKKFQNRHKGERVFIIGNGPSINNQDLTLLRNERFIACNAFFLKSQKINLPLDYYCVEDIHPAWDNRKEILDINCNGVFIPSDLSWMFKNDKKINFLNFQRSYLQQSHKQFPLFSNKVHKKVFWGGTVTYLSMQLAAHMGFKEIYLIGVDLSYSIPEDATIKGNVITTKGADPNHFDSRYFGYGKKWHLPNTKGMKRNIISGSVECEKLGIKVFNATKGGNLNEIPRVKFEDLFK